MSIGLRVRYQQIFDGTRPDIHGLLQNFSSKFVIAFLATINDKLLTDGTNRAT